VTTRLPGAAPEQVESEVTDRSRRRSTPSAASITLTSTSSEGVSQVVVGFKLEKNTDVADAGSARRVNRILPLLPRTSRSRSSKSAIRRVPGAHDGA
jgi:multidrug efflux pump subunit AcrB